MNRLIASVSIVTLALAASTAVAAVGRTAGSFAVSPAGAATYSIPIWVPPGPRGVQPNLAITYNSHSGSSTLGPGWAISGLSAITRCEKTVAQDPSDTPNGVTLTYNDVFCMDGKRLRLYGNTVAYGQPGSQYQTEIADFSLVTANGTQGNGPATFTVKAKNGWTYEYGNGGNSQVIASGTTTVSVWMLNKITDRSNNRMIVSYLAPDANRVGSTVPDEISWTADSYNSGTFSYKVKFNYIGNNSQGTTSGYVAGTPVLNGDLLANISVSSSGTTKKKYVFGYEISPTTGGNRLAQIKECADAAEADCLAPTTVAWQNGQAGVPSSGTGSYSFPFEEQVQYGVRLYDANGDGYPDRFYRNGGTWYVAFGSATGFGTGVSTGAPVAQGWASEAIGDVLGNGRAGILANNGTYYWWNGSAFTSAATGNVIPANTIPILADGNGDGRADLFYLIFTPGPDQFASGSAAIYMRASTGSGSSPSFGAAVGVGGGGGLQSATLSPTATTLPFMDINGDGHEDLMMRVGTLASCDPLLQCTYDGGWVALVSQSNGTYAGLGVGSVTAYGSTIPTFVNWNNDACTDIVYANEVLISGCNGTTTTYLPINSLNGIGALDWDGDGRSDLLVNMGSTIGVRLSSGTDISPTVINTGIAISNAITSSCSSVYTIDVDGDGLDDLACWGPTPAGVTYYRHNSPDTIPNLLTSVTDGFGVVVSPSYVALSRAVATGVYDATSDATWPYKDYNGPYYVVGSYSATDGTGIVDGNHNYNVQFRYSRGWMHNLGRGFAGFDSVRTIDSRNSLQAYRYFWRDFPYTGILRQEEVFQSNGTTSISQTVNTRASAAATWADQTFGQERYFPKVTNSIRQQREMGGPKNGQLVTTASTDFTFDAFGNAYIVAETITDNDPTSPTSGSSWTSTTSATISADTTSNWCLNVPTAMQVTRTAPGVSGFITRAASFVPDYANCRVTRKTTEPSSSTYNVQQDFGYDSFGNVNSLTTTGAGMPARVSGINWGATGQLPATSTNALNEPTTYGYDFGLGLLTSVTDANNIIVSFQYDTFGRQIRENRADGTATTWSFAACAPSCVSTTNILSVTETVLNVGGSTQTDSVAYLDRFGRPLTRQTRLLDGSYQRVDTQYDGLGRVSGQAAPCQWTSCAYYWTTFAYDALGRTTQVQRPVSAANSATLQTMTIEYAGRTTTTTDPQLKQSVNVTSVAGTLLRTQDHNGHYQNFVSDGFGSLLSVTDSAGTPLFTATYDYGVGAFQRSTTDTDLGPRSYNYNALGELISYSDNNQHSFGMSYDALSRPLVRTEPDLTTSFTYGNSAASHNIGQLQSVSATSSAGTYAEAFTYDVAGRPGSRSITIPSDTPSIYTYDTTYNSSGLPETLTYPADEAGNRLKLQYAYANGILQSVSNYNSPSAVYWAANATNVAGQVTQETLGNGVVTNRAFDAVTGSMSTAQSGLGGGAVLQNEAYLYDLVGNVTQRQNNNVGLTENFYYDNLYRLDHSTLGGGTNLSLTYDATGNILTRSTVAGGATWTYGTSRKHAVTQAGSGAYSYTYDGNGNVTSRNGNTINWTSFDHPSVINGPSGESIAFAYNHEHLRWRVTYNGSAGVETTLMIGGLLEKVLTAGSADYRHFIKVGGSTVAIFSRTGAGVVTVRYLLQDHQGSVAGILNADGTTYIKESFTAFGERRNQCTWSGAPTQGTQDKIAAVTRHGYTWHTALADWGLNDMNGRIQDAVTGRFLSPDPYVQDPTNTQSFNRYSYVLNNPLTYTDPSGFQMQEVTVSASGGWSSWGPCDYVSCSTRFAGAAVMDESQQQAVLAALQASAAAAEQAAENGMQQVVVSAPKLSDKPRPQGESWASRAAFKYIVQPVFGWIDCAAGGCTALEATTKFAGAPLMAASLIDGGAEGEVAMATLPTLRGLVKDASKAFSKAKQALVDMAKMDKRRGMTSADMQAYKDLNRELPDPFPTNKVRGPEAHSSGGPQSQQPHGHVGPVDHIPIVDAAP